jgi:glycosyltransferase involved in cell wall biosynthesis
MYRDHTIAAIVPAYNEEKLIGTVIRTMPDYVDHIVVVDDCSPDGTSEAALAVGDPRVTLVRLPENRGVGGAVITGHRKAAELGADIDVVMAGDGQMDPDYLPDLLEPLVDGGRGFAKANRFYSLDSFQSMPRHRIFGNIVLSFLTKLASGYWHLFDPQNGYTAITQDTLRRIPLDRVASRYSFENDLLIHLNILRVPAIDVPVPAVYGDAVSSIKLRKVIPELLRLLFVGFWKRFFFKYVLWSFSPIALFLFMGLFLTLFGTGWGIWVLIETLGPPEASAGSVVLSIAPLLIGLQMLLYALLLDIQESPDSPMTIDYRRLHEPAAGGQARPPVEAPARSTTFTGNLVDGTGHRANGAVRQPGSQRRG